LFYSETHLEVRPVDGFSRLMAQTTPTRAVVGLLRYRDNTGQNKAKKRPEGSRGQTGSRNMAATRFSDSASPIYDLTKSRRKYTTTSGLTTTFLTHFSDKNKFHCISDHFLHFGKYFRFLNCTSGSRFRLCAPDVLTESISSRLCAIRR